MSSKFFSITKFVEFMNDKYNNPSGVIVYFEASQAFMSKFDKICVKPVMINVCHSVAHAPAGRFQKLKDVYIKHEDIIKMFDGLLILTFTENRSRHFPRVVVVVGGSPLHFVLRTSLGLRNVNEAVEGVVTGGHYGCVTWRGWLWLLTMMMTTMMTMILVKGG